MANLENKQKVLVDQPGVIPFSADDLQHTDKDGNKLYTITAMEE